MLSPFSVKIDPTSQIPASVQLVDGFYKAMKDTHQYYQRQWFLNIANYFGQQYLVFDRARNVFTMPLAPSWRVRMVVNKILPLTRTLLSKVKETNLNFYVAPRTDEQSDIDAADIATKIVENVYYSSDFDCIRDEFVDWQVLTGNGFMMPYYNDMAGKRIQEEQKDAQGNPMMGPDNKPLLREFYTGDIDFDPIPPFELVPDFTATRWNEMTGVIRLKIRPVSYIKEKYGIDVSAEEISNEMIEYLKVTNMVSADGVKSDVRNIIKEAVIVKEYFGRPTKEAPKGKHIIVANSKELFSSELDTSINGKIEIPIIFAPAIAIPGKLLGMSPVENALPLQWKYNRIRSQMIEHCNLVSGPKLFAQEGSLIEGTYTDRPLEVTQYAPGAPVPTYQTPPSMPNYITESLRLLITELEDVFGIHDISQGRLPRRATSGVALSILEEKDSTVVSPMKAAYTKAMEKVFSMALAIASEKFSESRVLKIVGRNKETKIINYTKSDLKSNDDVRVIQDSNLPASRSAKLELGINLAEKGLISPQKALKMMGLDSLADLEGYTSGEIDRRNAEYENFEMSKGKKMYPSEIENFDEHIGTHENFLKVRQHQLDDATIQMVKDHIDLTKSMKNLVQQPVMPGIPPQQPPMPFPVPAGEPEIGLEEGVG